MKKIRFELSTNNVGGGMLAIVVRCSQDEKCIDIDTDVRVFKGEWDDTHGLIADNPGSRKLNRIIREVVYELEGIELDYGDGFTLRMLKELWDCKSTKHDFYEFMFRQISSRTDIRESTKRIHYRTLKHLRDYKEECFLGDLTENFIVLFIEQLKKQGLMSTTIAMLVRVFRSYYNIARKTFGNKVPLSSFEFYQSRSLEKQGDKIKNLCDEDIRLLEKYIASPSRKSRDVDMVNRFLFMAYTGTRISDFQSLNQSNFTQENDGMWLTYRSIKTNTSVRVPLYAIFDGRAELIITKYWDSLDIFFRIRGHFNKKIKRIAKLAGINKYISAHVARHTCASRLINKDIPVTTVQRIVGHRSIKTTMIYAKTNENTIVRQLQR
ncbi:MAG: tyrosine-type recombinase/integrase [Phocaeicola sp.]